MIIQPPEALRDFPLVVEIPVQWGDQDAFGHVNNAAYFRWFESARIVDCTFLPGITTRSWDKYLLQKLKIKSTKTGNKLSDRRSYWWASENRRQVVALGR